MWNHRIISHNKDGEVYLKIHEVFYDENGEPESYTENPVHVEGEDMEEIESTLQYMLKCISKPVLSVEDFEN